MLYSSPGLVQERIKRAEVKDLGFLRISGYLQVIHFSPKRYEAFQEASNQPDAPGSVLHVYPSRLYRILL